jgi:oligoribonuclease NrnB/cAMP/cGMP phosphodiesterase (DHH superfamily)
MPACYLISHREDVDGIASAALLRGIQGALGFETKAIFLVFYHEFRTRVAECCELIAESPAIEHHVFISDVGLNPGASVYFERLSAAGARVWYFDHHEASASEIQAVDAACDPYQHVLEVCSAENIALYFPDRIDAPTRELVAWAHQTDFHEGICWQAAALQKIIAHRVGDHDFLVDLTGVLALPPNDRDQWIKTQQVVAEEARVAALAAAEQRVIQFTTTSGDLTVRTALTVTEWTPGEIGRMLEEKFPGLDGYFTISPPTRGTNLKGPHLVMARIARRHGGGGHPERAGFVLSPDDAERYRNDASARQGLLETLTEELAVEIAKIVTST